MILSRLKLSQGNGYFLVFTLLILAADVNITHRRDKGESPGILVFSCVL
jgi:hypothetical protein